MVFIDEDKEKLEKLNNTISALLEKLAASSTGRKEILSKELESKQKAFVKLQNKIAAAPNRLKEALGAGIDNFSRVV